MKILVAEDEKDIADAIGIILKYSGFESDVVYDGLTALDYAHKNIYDGIVLDIMMPGLDGIGVLTALREEGDNTPILMLTAKAQVEDKILGLESGADDYLAKPFDKGELVARIKVMTRRNETGKNNQLTVGNTKLNIETLEISRVDSSLRLSGKEVEVLAFLMKNSGKEIEEQAVIEKVWEKEEYEEGTLNLYINYLKNKLNAIHSDIEITRIREGIVCLESLDGKS